MRSRSWLSIVKFVFLTVCALVAADLIGLVIRARTMPAPVTTIKKVADTNAGAVTISEQQAVQESKVLLGQAPDITRETPKPSGSSSTSPSAGRTASPVEQVPDPSQTMTLVGTVASPGASIAIVVANGKEQVLHEGDAAGPFRVTQIRDSSLILEMKGQTRTLWMPSFAPAPSTASPNVGLLPPPPVPVAAQTPVPDAAGNKALVSRTERDAAMGNLDQSLKDLRIIPFKKNGTDYGARVEFLRPGSFLSKVGLAQGDVLLAVNSRPVNNAEQGLEVFQAFQHEDRIVMRIDRDGRVFQQEVIFR